MPRDQRLYMTFPIDFWQHPKITILSDSAFRTFVEMNGYSRTQDLDGRIPVPAAKRMWKPRALAELQQNHPERPSLTVEGDEYVIWNYAEHQLTRADREALAEKNRANGMKGGRPRKNPPETQSVSDGNPEGTHSKAESESRSESGSERTTDTHIRLVPETGRDDLTDDRNPVDNSAHWAQFGITDFAKVRGAILAALGHPVTEAEAGRIVGWIMAKAEASGTKPRSMQAYVLGSIRGSWAEVQQYWHESVAS